MALPGAFGDQEIDVMKTTMRAILWLAVLSGLGVFFTVSNCSDSRPAPSSTTAAVTPTATPKDDKAWKQSKKVVDLMLKQGTLRRIDPRSRKAWVDSMTWLMLDAQAKENVTRALAIYAMPQYPEIEIVDAQSARKLASFGPFQGFKVY